MTTKMRTKTVDFKKKQSRATAVLPVPPGNGGCCSVLFFIETGRYMGMW